MDFDKLRGMAAYDLRQYNELMASDDPTDREKAALIKRILSKLKERERIVLEWFYINRHKYHRMEMLAILDLKSTSNLYAFKERALAHYYTYMLAVLQSGDDGEP